MWIPVRPMNTIGETTRELNIFYSTRLMKLFCASASAL